MAARRNRLANLALMVFDLMIERYQSGILRKYDDVESSGLIDALRVCSHYMDQITCLPSDDLCVIEIKGIDGHSYTLQFRLHGPGFSLHAARVRVTELSLRTASPGQVSATWRRLDLLDDHSERAKLSKVTVDRAFLIGMSMVIGLMDEQGDDQDEQLRPLVQMITPSREELRRMRESSPVPVIALDDDPC
jgi:hypothetical protein